MQEQTTAKQTKGKFLPKSGKKRRRTILAAVIAAAVIAGVLFLPKLVGSQQDTPLLDLADTTVLSYMDLRDTISATGIVESAQSHTVYSTMAYTVMAVHAEVGDYVQEGDLLAELDDHTIRNQIASQQISLDLSEQSSNQQLQTAQDNYNNFKSGIDQGLNATLNNARNQAQTALEAYEKAQLTYDRYVASLSEGENTALINADAALRSAEYTMQSAADSYDAALEAAREANRLYEEALLEDKPELDRQQELLDQQKADRDALQAQLDELDALRARDETTLTPEELARLQQLESEEASLRLELTAAQEEINRKAVEVMALETAFQQIEDAAKQTDAQVEAAAEAARRASEAYDTQLATFRATNTTVDNTLQDYLTNVQTAWDNYQEALVSLASTEKTVKEQLQSYGNNVAGAEIGTNKAAAEESLRQLTETLEDTKITAPCAGTVTAVYAEVGSAGSGLLFVIEDLDNLIVDTSVKGYDMGTVQTGMKVAIRSDATGDTEIDGVIASIAPTSTKNAMGASDLTTGDPTFAAEVQITAPDSGLRIGMEAQLDYIIAEENHVLAVPYDAVYENEQGVTCVLIATEQADGKYYIGELPVTPGMDDDLDMVITGTGVTEGLRVIHTPEHYLPLLGQTVTAGIGLRSDLISVMMGG